MSDGHIVYFIGGPLDLTKKVNEGDVPSDGTLHMRAIRPYKRHMDDVDKELTLSFETHVYRLMAAPRMAQTHDRRRVFIALYDGTTQL